MKVSSINLLIVFVAVFVVSETRNVVQFSVRTDELKDTFCNVDFRDCGSVLGKIIGVSFNGTCTSRGFAVLKKGTVISIDYKFQAFHSEAVLTSTVHGQIDGLPFVPFPLDNPNACVNSGLSCPIQANTTLDFTPVLNVLKSYPAVQSVIVKWELRNKDKTDVFCVLMPATIVD